MKLEMVRLGDLVDNFDNLRRPVRSVDRAPGEYPYYGASGVIDHIDGFTHEGEHLLIAEDGENLRSRSTPVAFMARGRFWANNHVHVVRANRLSVSKFLELKLAVSDISGYLTGSTLPKLSRSAMDSIVLAIPSFSDQKAIAEVLVALDDKITANAGIIVTSSDLAALEFEKVLREGGVEVELGAVTELLARGITPAYTEDSDAMTILNQKCVRDRRVDLEKARKTSLGKVRPEKILRLGDVLVNSTGYGTLGRVARWTGSGQVTVDSHITIVRFDSSKVERTCGGFALLRLEDEIEAMGEGSTGQTELSRVELGRLRVRVPRADAQGPLGSRLDALTRLVDSRLAESVRLAELRDTLLPQLMSGRLRVKDAEKRVEAVV